MGVGDLNLLRMAACTLRKRWADAADFKRYSCALAVASLGGSSPPEPLSVTAGQLEIPERGAVGSQFVSYDQPGREAILSEQLAHQL
jgi:hypothetical protein